jgi:hypothetical protein
MRKWIGVTAAVSALDVMGALPAGAGKDGGFAPLHVRKLVVGPVPPGTQFVVTIDCGDDIIFTGVSNPVSSVQLVFDAQGNPVGTGDTVMFMDGGNCTVTETQNGGAVSVIYECEGTFGPRPPTVQGSEHLRAGSDAAGSAGAGSGGGGSAALHRLTTRSRSFDAQGLTPTVRSNRRADGEAIRPIRGRRETPVLNSVSRLPFSEGPVGGSFPSKGARVDHGPGVPRDP